MLRHSMDWCASDLTARLLCLVLAFSFWGGLMFGPLDRRPMALDPLCSLDVNLR